MAISPNRKDREQQSFIENSVDGGVDRRVNDQIAHTKLDSIAAALGAATTTTPTIFNVSVVAAASEVSQALPANCKRFIIKARGNSKLQLAYSSGQSGTTYVTIPAGAVFEDTSFYTSQTLYFQSSKAGETVEITAYS